MAEIAEAVSRIALEDDRPSISSQTDLLSEPALPLLLRFLNFILDPTRNVLFEETRLENVRHLPLLSDGRLFIVRDDLRSQATGEPRVCKVFKKSITPGSSNLPTGDEFRHLLREIRLHALPGTRTHHNITTLSMVSFGISAFNPVEICPVLKTPAAEFGNLDDFQSALPEISFESRLHLCADIAAGLWALHEAHFVHGSLTPSHVLVYKHAERGHIAKLCGFGNSFSVDELDGLVGRTADPWMAPEVIEGCIRDENVLMTDVFPLGLLLWQVIAHRSPFKAFDIPLDEESSKAELLEILRLPYLFRFASLIVDHELGGLLAQDIIDFMDDLFAITLRLNPAKRSLAGVCDLLEAKTGRKLEVADNSADANLSRRETNFEHTTLEGTDDVSAIQFVYELLLIVLSSVTHLRRGDSPVANGSSITACQGFGDHYWICRRVAQTRTQTGCGSPLVAVRMRLPWLWTEERPVGCQVLSWTAHAAWPQGIGSPAR